MKKKMSSKADSRASERRTKRGTVHPSRTMFFRVKVGEAKGGDMVYELDTNMGGSSPIVHSKQTGKWFTLSWQDIIELAIEAGVDDP